MAFSNVVKKMAMIFWVIFRVVLFTCLNKRVLRVFFSPFFKRFKYQIWCVYIILFPLLFVCVCVRVGFFIHSISYRIVLFAAGPKTKPCTLINIMLLCYIPFTPVFIVSQQFLYGARITTASNNNTNKLCFYICFKLNTHKCVFRVSDTYSLCNRLDSWKGDENCK